MGVSSSTQRLARRRKKLDVTARTRQPASRAPRDTPSITPPYPPVQTANPSAASSRPNSMASVYSAWPSSGRGLPKTVIVFILSVMNRPELQGLKAREYKVADVAVETATHNDRNEDGAHFLNFLYLPYFLHFPHFPHFFRFFART